MRGIGVSRLRENRRGDKEDKVQFRCNGDGDRAEVIIIELIKI